MPTNTFGQNDKYDTLNSHFIPSLIKKIYEIEKKNKNEITLWGDGTPKREIIYVDDIADACIYFMNKKTSHSLINIGTGKEDTIKGIAQLFLKTLIPEKKIQIKFDKSKPNGIKRKVLDTSLAKAKMIKHLVKNKLGNKYPNIAEGDKIRFLHLRQPNIYQSSAFSFITKMPKELDIVNKIDYDTQFSKAFVEPIRFITDKIQWKIDDSYGQQGTLEDFF